MPDIEKLKAAHPEAEELALRAQDILARTKKNPNDQYAIDLAKRLQADAEKFFTRFETEEDK
jgi:hypothetical protein